MLVSNIKLVFLFAAAFLVLAPLSISGTAGDSLKYARLFTTFAMVMLGVLYYPLPSFGRAAKSLLAFVVVFWLAGLWSDSPAWALFHKGMFFLTAMAGVIMALAIRDYAELTSVTRFLGLTGAISALFLLVTYLRNPETSVVGDRLAVAGMNANTVGQAGAPILILAYFLLLSENAFKLKVIYGLGCAFAAFVVLGSGSRGAALMAAVGMVVVSRTFLRRRFFTFMVILALPFMAMQFSGAFAKDSSGSGSSLELVPGVSRLTNRELSKRNTRAGVWAYTWKRFRWHPLQGTGWMHFGHSTMNCFSVYIQTLAECGLLGGGLFVLILFSTYSAYLERRGEIDPKGEGSEYLALPVAFLCSLLVHGTVESATLLGTSSNALFLGFSVGLMDRLGRLLGDDRRRKEAPEAKRLDLRPRFYDPEVGPVRQHDT